jgi:hypothetical protein
MNNIFGFDLNNLYKDNEIEAMLKVLNYEELWKYLKENSLCNKAIICPSSIASELEHKKKVTISTSKKNVIDCIYYIFKRTEELFITSPEKPEELKKLKRHSKKINNLFIDLNKALSDKRFEGYNKYILGDTLEVSVTNPDHCLKTIAESFRYVAYRSKSALVRPNARNFFQYDQTYFDEYEIEKVLSNGTNIQLTNRSESPQFTRYFMIRIAKYLNIQTGLDKIENQESNLITGLYTIFESLNDKIKNLGYILDPKDTLKERSKEK